jgi:hypothetical protein
VELRTERLVLRPVTEDDVDAMLAVRNAPAVIGTTNTKEPGRSPASVIAAASSTSSTAPR